MHRKDKKDKNRPNNKEKGGNSNYKKDQKNLEEKGNKN